MKFVKDKLKNLTLNITDGEHSTVNDTPNTNFYLLSNKNIINSQIVISDEDRTISKTTLDKIRPFLQRDGGDLNFSFSNYYTASLFKKFKFP